MQTIEIIVSILNIAAYFSLVLLACYLFFQLRKMKEQADFISIAMSKVYAIVSAIKLQHDFDKISEMEELLTRLIKDENYEEAQKLRDLLESNTKEAYKALEMFKETFGDIATELVKIKLKAP